MMDKHRGAMKPPGAYIVILSTTKVAKNNCNDKEETFLASDFSNFEACKEGEMPLS